MTVGELMDFFAEGIERGLYTGTTPVEVACWGSDGESDRLEPNAWTVDGRVILKTVVGFDEDGLIDNHKNDVDRAFWAIMKTGVPR